VSDAPAALEVVEFTDPVCPWAWGSEPTLRRLRELLPPGVRWRRVFGILFDVDDDPPPDPAAETAWYHGQLAEIAGHTGAPYPRVLERVALTSWPPSLVAKAAEAQGPAMAEHVLRRLREQTFLVGIPPDTTDRALAAVRGVPGLDLVRLARDAATPTVARAVARDRAETRAPVAEVRLIEASGPHSGQAKPVDGGHRYALPTVLLRGPGGQVVVPGWRTLSEYLDAADRVVPRCVARDLPLSDVDSALRRYRSLTEPDLRTLTGSSRPPRDGVVVATAAGPIWLHPDEAATHPATRIPPAERPAE
jgi:predicted DsbA family dithiol-disulfide isomerase